jgi:hypothetical protein
MIRGFPDLKPSYCPKYGGRTLQKVDGVEGLSLKNRVLFKLASEFFRLLCYWEIWRVLSMSLPFIIF